MAWVNILDSGASPIGWDYDNAATKYGGVAGIRTNTDGNEVYVSCKITGEDLTGFANEDRGEISKTYWDNNTI